ncbi:hypothetical protein EHI8A_183220 [Entamoeba histolytica HM-1:IMSS-B]|uniref:Uncharacterized protein n=6 Tax=Entamoeba histolytica TaxID=5759 RepID=C4LTL9_ENTH1|nr:hypothetical protein EHI_012260 [Entamoeba histolytica HM-1:IMSS]EMD43239.1 Hypothetical protein EHI5A_020510 [Entamoeba histolytica KU27]EMH75188.1 hypothetical protein EHI8A_183220 [Entamoeba histolytica HM-1:IMSS-B]EMS16053.1 hypothetical protein KM1_252930 [Entamoeba histolytica HM-3:IMSS]ENY61042.1 hypothetical protein EHI7A_162810 [Entamoeba histolytica HM-1:IMSS-A]GAT91912.1 hypothetical protein CL6EHI_012260 [Entamoeba histolytica]|eukprot:XP_656182.1 hypothetical protein EHI_012260 [Entamoeba histolytica HM-1:IMSS]
MIKDKRKTEEETEKKEDDKKEKQENKEEIEGKEEDGKIKVEKEYTKSRRGNSFRQTLLWLTEELNKERKRQKERKKKKIKETAIVKSKPIKWYCESLKKENTQFKCIICKGKPKEETICLVNKETILVINQERE